MNHGTQPASERMTLPRQVLLLSAGALLCLFAAPVAARAASPSPSPSSSSSPSPKPPEPSLKLTKVVDAAGPQPVGRILTYTVTLTNTSASIDGTRVVGIDDQFTSSGGATGVVAQPVASDGGAGDRSTDNGDPHFVWQSKPLAHGTSSTLTVKVEPLSPGTISNTAYDESTNCAAAGAPACTVTTVIVPPPSTPPPGGVGGITSPPPGGVQGISTPAVGSNTNIPVGGLLLLGGVALILFGLLARRPRGLSPHA